MRKNWIVIIAAILTLSLFQVVGSMTVFANEDSETVIVATEDTEIIDDEEVIEEEGIESEEANPADQPYGDEEDIHLDEGEE